ncbi:MAG: hypothetical protein IKO47_12100 [Ruminococcus sp.]|nr:hypothetical protein [Ruminococcus sp.]
MELIYYPSADAVKVAAAADEPLIAAIFFDGKKAAVSTVDISPEHHILLMNAGFSDTDIENTFRIVFDRSGADWTFVCPENYRNIPYKDKRIKAFHKDGFAVIADFLQEVGYIVGIDIPKRYRRHLDVLTKDTY